MNCFDHPDRAAIAVCTVCAKGRCKECLVDLGRATSCKGACEIEARRLIDLRDYSFAAPSLADARMKWAADAQRRGSIFNLVLGAVFIAFGFWDPAFKFFFWMGGLLAAFGIFNFWRSTHRNEPKQFRLCANCGYNISRNTTNRCPECGHIA